VIIQVSPYTSVTLDGSGNGQVAIGPPAGTKWALQLATLAVSTASGTITKQPQGFLYRGSASGPIELIDSTYTGAQASSTKVGGAPYFPGQLLWAVWKDGDSGAVATVRAYGQQGGRSDPFDPSPVGQGFDNPIVAGTSLVIPAINSPGYVAGTSGWSINADGTADFNSGTFRGSVLIGGPPAAGAVSLGLRGTDIPAALRNFNAQYDVWYEADVYWYSTTDFTFRALAHNSFFGLAEYIEGDVISGAVHLQRFVDGPGGAANAIHFGTVEYLVDQLLVDFRATDVVIRSSATLKAANPANDTTEVWHALTLANGWVNYAGGEVTAQYRKVAAPDNCVQLVGLIKSGTTADGTVIGTLPAGYTPAHHVPGWGASSANGARTVRVDLQTNGTLTILGVPAGGDLALNGIYSLDA
jgi:hypothetical protein